MTMPAVEQGAQALALGDLLDVARSLPLEDKVALLTGESTWRLRAIPAVGLERLTFSDGPVGVRGTSEIEGETSVLFPSPSALSAAWDPALAREVGNAFAREARGHGADVVLAPQINIQRTPVGGRHFECYSEDPLLTGVVGAQVIAGIQEHGVAACVKHYIANDAETDRTTAISRVDERTLREVYLAPFEAALEVGAWSIMAAYNQTDDGAETSHMTAHRHLLRDVLKDELGFDGVVVSDWVATQSTEASANGGLDVVMPGPGGPWEDALLAAVRDGRVPESEIDDKVARILLLARRTGRLDAPEQPIVGVDDLAALVRRAAARGTVALRRDDDAPLWERPAPATIALIGPNAVRPHVLGGGSSTVHPAHVVTPLEGLQERYPDAEISVHRGGDPRRFAPRLDLDALGGSVVARHLAADGTVLREDALASWNGALGDLPAATHTIELDVEVTLGEPGEHRIEVGTVGAHRIDVDGRLVSTSDVPVGVEVILDSSINNPSGIEAPVTIDEPRRVAVRTRHLVIDAGGYGRMIRAEFRHRLPGASVEQEIADAVAAAASADLAVVIVGTNEEVESEGWDRDSIDLPGPQNELVTRVLAARPDAVIVINAGAPVLLPWLEAARTALWVWFPGQEAGHSIADVVSGDVEPAGRLPWTLPASAADVPVPHAIPVDGVVDYTDGIHVGYRGWLRSGATPALPFGHGLGWSAWTYDDASVAVAADGGLDVQITVTNVGAKASREVVQAYLSYEGDVERPVRWLAGFAAAEVAPGESRRVAVSIPRRQLEVWDAPQQKWSLPHGDYTVHIGRSANDIRVDMAVQAGDVTTGRSDS